MRGAENTFDIDKARELVGNPVLWPRVRDFLWDFAPQVHESWLANVCGRETSDERREADALHVARLASHSRVRRFVLEQLGVEPCFHDFPKDDGSRLLLLDGETLLEMVKWLGALACAEDLRKVTDGKSVKALKSEFAGVYPEVFGYTAYFDLAAENAKSAKAAGEICTCGFEILLSVVSGLPASLVARLKFKLPRKLCDICGLCGKKERLTSYSAILKLLKLKFPEAYSLCCS